MASYLEKIAARALGTLDVARPRQPARFEPVVASDVGPGDMGEIVEMVEADEAEPPAATLPWVEDVPRVRPADARNAPRPTLPDEAGPDRSPRASHPRVETPAGASPVPPFDREAPAAPVESLAAMPERPLAPSTSEERRGAESRSPAAPSRPGRPPRAWAQQIAERDGDRPLPPAVAREPAPSMAPVIETTRQETISPSVGPPGGGEPGASMIVQMTPARDESEASRPVAGDADAPSITVSIGRIEVRATRPEGPRAPARPPRPQPRLTLDAFLSRQGRGR